MALRSAAAWARTGALQPNCRASSPPRLPALALLHHSRALRKHPPCRPPSFPFSVSPTPPAPCSDELFWLLERVMPRLHERGAATKPTHILGIADPSSVPQVGSLSSARRPPLCRRRCGLGLGLPGAQPLLCVSASQAVPPTCTSPPCPPWPRAQLVTYGADTFDSCYPTRVGRHGTMLTDAGPLRVVRRGWKLDLTAGGPLQPVLPLQTRSVCTAADGTRSTWKQPGADAACLGTCNNAEIASHAGQRAVQDGVPATGGGLHVPHVQNAQVGWLARLPALACLAPCCRRLNLLRCN